MELNDFFSNAVINLKISKFENFDPLSENIVHPTLIASEFTKECFSFNTITIEDALKEVSMLDNSKAV